MPQQITAIGEDPVTIVEMHERKPFRLGDFSDTGRQAIQAGIFIGDHKAGSYRARQKGPVSQYP
jgi:hypothetical protein